jgi:hypothetical protein
VNRSDSDSELGIESLGTNEKMRRKSLPLAGSARRGKVATGCSVLRLEIEHAGVLSGGVLAQ